MHPNTSDLEELYKDVHRYAPLIHPTLETGVETLVAAASAWPAA
jgi:hypothetical protein